MSYFGASLGQRPGPETDKPKTTSQEAIAEGQKPATQPHFTSQIGPRPARLAQSPPSVPPSPTPVPELPRCPLCRGALALENGLYHCQGRCGGRWLAPNGSPDHLVDVAALPYGACACCEPPQALIKSDAGLLCPQSARAYLLLPDGTTTLADATPYGVCQCCLPPMPLAWNEGKIVCLGKMENVYQHDGSGFVLGTPSRATATPQETLQAIDEALRRNDAWVTVNGLFDVD